MSQHRPNVNFLISRLYQNVNEWRTFTEHKKQIKANTGVEIILSKCSRSLTGVERPCDESVQVLCELEDLPLAPFPAAHRCFLEGAAGGGGAWKRSALKVDSGGKRKEKKKQSKKEFYFDKVQRPLLSSTRGGGSAWPLCLCVAGEMSE